MIITREYELIKELVERGASLEYINEMYEVAKQEKEKKEQEAKIKAAREKVAEATADYMKLLTGVDMDVAKFIKEAIKEEKRIQDVDFTKVEVQYNQDAVNEWLKKKGYSF